MKALFGKTIDLLTMMADFRSRRHQVITSNVTNLDSADYRPADLTFGESLMKAMEETGKLPLTKPNERHMPPGLGAGQKPDYQLVDTDSKVSLDKEMANLAENHLMYNLTVELLARKFRGLNTVLKETK